MAPWLRDDVISTINRNIVRSVPLFDKMVRSHPVGGHELLQHLIDIMCAKVRQRQRFHVCRCRLARQTESLTS